MCAAAMSFARIRQLYYGAADRGDWSTTGRAFSTNRRHHARVYRRCGKPKRRAADFLPPDGSRTATRPSSTTRTYASSSASRPPSPALPDPEPICVRRISKIAADGIAVGVDSERALASRTACGPPRSARASSAHWDRSIDRVGLAPAGARRERGRLPQADVGLQLSAGCPVHRPVAANAWLLGSAGGERRFPAVSPDPGGVCSRSLPRTASDDSVSLNGLHAGEVPVPGSCLAAGQRQRGDSDQRCGRLIACADGRPAVVPRVSRARGPQQGLRKARKSERFVGIGIESSLRQPAKPYGRPIVPALSSAGGATCCWSIGSRHVTVHGGDELLDESNFSSGRTQSGSSPPPRRKGRRKNRTGRPQAAAAKRRGRPWRP